MPVEIRELIIRAVVNDSQNRGEAKTARDMTPVDTDEIVEECVKQVLSILNKSQER